jgi:cytoskeletal protein CcmA (bactofilin family)
MSKTVIGAGTRVAGPLHGTDDLLIEGTVEGPVTGEALVTLAESATVKGAIRGRDVVIAGKLAWDVFGSASVTLTATAQLTGNIESPRVAMEPGALFEGQVRMKRSATPRAVAAPPVAAAPPPPPPPEIPAIREIPTLPAIGKRKLTRRDA